MSSRIGSPSEPPNSSCGEKDSMSNRIVKPRDIIGMPHPWRRNAKVKKDNWRDRFDKRIVLWVQLGICHPDKSGPALIFLQFLPTSLTVFP
jgi:hypothetical protein